VRLLREALELLPMGPPTHPANLDALIRQLGVEVRYRRDRMAFYGSTDLEREVPLIELAWVRRTDSPSLLPWGDGERLSNGLPHQYDARTRFTLAHEFGHVLLDRLDGENRLPRGITPQSIENLCDAIGAELLMPTNWFKSKVGPDASFNDLRRVSLRAGTSISATVVRARKLGYGIAALHLTLGSPDPWRVDRSYGFGDKALLSLSAASAAYLNTRPMKSVARSDIELACVGHSHKLQAEVRRTFRSAVVVAHRVDDTRIRANSSWRCTNGPNRPPRRIPGTAINLTPDSDLRSAGT
jgi:IrrE N-terminal-like domain